MLKARRALAADPDLAPLNLGVSVRRGVATLWGTAPSSALAREALLQLRQLPDLEEVRSELEIDSFLTVDMEPEPPPVLRPQRRQAMAAASERQGPAPGALAGREARGPAPAVPQPLPAGSPAPLNNSVTLLAPVPLSGQAPLTPRPPPVPPFQVSTLLQKAVQLRDQDARFQRVQVEVRGRVVFLHGLVARGEDTMELAQRISRLPGVERVVLENVRVDPRLQSRR
jgi:hypothetical protein